MFYREGKTVCGEKIRRDAWNPYRFAYTLEKNNSNPYVIPLV